MHEDETLQSWKNNLNTTEGNIVRRDTLNFKTGFLNYN